MEINKLIAELEALRDKYGNITVYTRDDDGEFSPLDDIQLEQQKDVDEKGEPYDSFSVYLW